MMKRGVDMIRVRTSLSVVLFAFVAALFGAHAVAGAGENLPGLTTPGKMVVGLDDTFAPMGFRDASGNLTGFDIDLAKAVGEEMGLEIVFQPVDWSTKEMELASGNVDCLWNGMSRTKEREAGMTLSQNYLNNKLVVMTNPDVKMETMDQLAEHQIGTQAASSALEAVKANPIYSRLQGNLHEYATYDDCILDMKADRIQAMVVDEVLGQYKNNNLGGIFKIAPVDFGDDYYVVGFRRDADNGKNEQLCKAVEAALKAVIASGKGAELSKKWFGADLLLEIK